MNVRCAPRESTAERNQLTRQGTVVQASIAQQTSQMVFPVYILAHMAPTRSPAPRQPILMRREEDMLKTARPAQLSTTAQKEQWIQSYAHWVITVHQNLETLSLAL